MQHDAAAVVGFVDSRLLTVGCVREAGDGDLGRQAKGATEEFLRTSVKLVSAWEMFLNGVILYSSWIRNIHDSWCNDIVLFEPPLGTRRLCI